MSLIFKPKSSNTLSFNEDGIAPQDYKLLTGLNKDEFDTLFNYCHIELRSSSNRTGRTALGVFLVKLRLNLSQEVLAFLFGVKSQVCLHSLYFNTFNLHNAFQKQLIFKINLSV